MSSNMELKCKNCGNLYQVSSFRIDKGFCHNCSPHFFSRPLWLKATPKGTASLWRKVILIHFIILLPQPLVLDAGRDSIPTTIYCLAIIGYFSLRLLIGHKNGYPVLGKSQLIGILLLPFYGLIGFIFLFHFVQGLK